MLQSVTLSLGATPSLEILWDRSNSTYWANAIARSLPHSNLIPMDNQTKTKQLFKILMGAAWIDGIIQAEEREYLRRMAQDKGIAEDAEIKSLLSEIKPVSATECYHWLETYLGGEKSEESYLELLESLSALVYSDGEVDTQEAKLLTKVQLLDPANTSPPKAFDRVLKVARSLYRRGLELGN
ncbi:MAG: TerB family tellurite resistance protein [Cyanobacteriota bacterium]|nr:TerB family tellurite resistance protein [Cyanobacteriota bacterium]